MNKSECGIEMLMGSIGNEFARYKPLHILQLLNWCSVVNFGLIGMRYYGMAWNQSYLV